MRRGRSIFATFVAALVASVLAAWRCDLGSDPGASVWTNPDGTFRSVQEEPRDDPDPGATAPTSGNEQP